MALRRLLAHVALSRRFVGGGATAQHALGGACVPGISGLGVSIRSAKDVILVPDEPQFTVGARVAVAAWVKPTSVAGDQPIVIKRLNNQTSFSLGIHKGNIEMSVVLTNGTTVISRAPSPPAPGRTWPACSTGRSSISS